MHKRKVRSIFFYCLSYFDVGMLRMKLEPLMVIRKVVVEGSSDQGGTIIFS